MPFSKIWDRNEMTDDTLAVFVLNVGHGDAIVIRFPVVDGVVTCGVVDCNLFGKTRDALESLEADRIGFLCATHPHLDHIRGFANLIEWCDNRLPIEQFWDGGFRHVSGTHYNVIRELEKRPGIHFYRVTSGFEETINGVRVLVLAPSIRLKNKYDTFGTEINNGSVVLKLEYPPVDAAMYYDNGDVYSDEQLAEEEKIAQNTMILGGDAQFDSWAVLAQEFPQQTRYAGANRGKLINRDDGWRRVTRKPLRSQVIKIPHHMSKNGISYEVLNNISAKYALVSCGSTGQHSCPHDLTRDAAAEVKGSETHYTGHEKPDNADGTLAVLFHGDGKDPKVFGLGDTRKERAPI